MPENRIRIAPNTVAYTDEENLKLVVEFAIPGARDIEYVAAMALAWPVKPDKAEAIYENGLLRIEVPFKDPMEDAVKVAVKSVIADTKIKKLKA
jgi:HSP20 family molecular chaperone IbpA